MYIILEKDKKGGRLIMYCPNCGKKVDNDALYCDDCGSLITHPQQKQDVSKNKKYYGSIVLVALIILVAVGYLYFNSMKHKDKQQNNTIQASDTYNSNDNQENIIYETLPAEISNKDKSKEEIAREVGACVKEFYLTYLDAINSQDETLMKNVADSLKNDRVNRMHRNSKYSYENVKIIMDYSSLEYDDETAVFKIKATNIGTDLIDYHTFNLDVCLHIETIYENGAWVVKIANQIDCKLLTENIIEL